MPKKIEVKEEVVKKTKQPTFYQAVGRRKGATGTVRLHVLGSAKTHTVNGVEIKAGDVLVNGKEISKYFSGAVAEKAYMEPFRTTNTLGRFAVTAIITGGGTVGQIGAFVLGTSRALEKVDKEKFRSILKKKGFMTRDPRVKERRKAGNAQKARAKKQSPKR